MHYLEQRHLARWFLLLTGAVWIMVGIGGLTRLLQAGLSIVVWDPIMGILPPLSEAAWHAAFQAYRATPEYQQLNYGMPLQEFQFIYWVEYLHRFLGRVVGMIALIPLILCYVRPVWRTYAKHFWFLGACIALQGAVGWYMVKSGLIHDPHVSPYRLTGHLMLAFFIGGYSLWQAARIIHMAPFMRLSLLGLLLLGLVAVTVFYGGLTAGHKAGLLYNMFPYMGDTLFPLEWMRISPWYFDLLANPASIQFMHRSFALITFSLVLGAFAVNLYRNKQVSISWLLLLTIVSIQVLLGIFTLLYQVPTWLGVAHQAWAYIVVISCLWKTYKLCYKIR